MDSLALALIVGSLMSTTLAFIFIALKLKGGGGRKGSGNPNDAYSEMAEKDVEHIFNNEFREELRNRGRLHFEKIIGENAMFLQQDLRLTTSQLNEFMKAEITKKLETEFSGYEQSITDAKNLAVESITKTQEAIEAQRQALSQQMTEEVERQKQLILQKFEQDMAKIVNHYIIQAIGDQIDVDDQIGFVIKSLESSKEDIVKDITGVK